MSDFDKVIILAHSMGNRVLLSALHHIKDISKCTFVLVAANITIDEFAQNGALYGEQHKTIYSHISDRPLNLASNITN